MSRYDGTSAQSKSVLPTTGDPREGNIAAILDGYCAS